ncbi:MAG: mandelate racemase/muconate lactonizing enzyme family protein [Candidatus Rokubacteria bacterium]|nr:mandelate racemase/muconate lactonizing enzyme family protein [Candidatus Rokubacteria bacterium]
MKITDVQPLALGIPYQRLDPPSPWTDGLRKQILVRVATDEGLVGVGEAFALGAPLAVCAVIEDALKPLLVGESPSEIERLTDRLHRATLLFGRRGLGMFALSGVELALWDLAGQVRGAPVYELFGGLVQPRVPAYASLLRYDRPDLVAAAARRVVAQGFRAVKLHQTDLASVRAARDAVGAGVELMLDVNCSWSPLEALRMGRALAEYELAWLEEPVWPPEDYRALAEVSAALDTPVAAGENEATVVGFREMIAQRAVDILQPSVTKVGGLGEAKKICALAAAWNVAVVPHSFYFGPGLAATLHLIAATPGLRYVEYPAAALESPLLTPPIQAVDGWIAVPTGPGLGVTVNEEAVRRYPYGAGGARPFTTASR